MNLERSFHDGVDLPLRARLPRGPDPAPLRALQHRGEVREPRREDAGARASSTWPPATTRARTAIPGPAAFACCKGRDPRKDQSYFLFGLTQEQLAAALFPVGHLEKAEVRRLARERGLPVADKAESQEICFVPDGDYAGFVEREAPAADRSGPDPRPRAGASSVATTACTASPWASGAGLGVTSARPLYVLEVRPAGAHGGGRRRGARCASDRLVAREVNWLSIPEPAPAAPRRGADPLPARGGAGHPPAPSAAGASEVRFDDAAAGDHPRPGRRLLRRRRLPGRRLDRGPRAFSRLARSRMSARRAAACCAAFFDEPSPSVTSPRRCGTRTRNRRRWLGPSSATTT